MSLRICSIALFSVVLQFVANAALPDIPADEDGAKTWKNRRVSRITERFETGEDVAFPEMGKMIRQLKSLNYRECAERDEVILRLQRTMLSHAGHAEYFSDQVSAARKSSQNFLADREYHRACETLRDTLRYMPSPETVQVLGGMLESLEDIPTSEQTIEHLRAVANGSDHKWFCPSRLAGQTLLALEIRDFPDGSGRNGTFSGDDVSPMRIWWESVKSGSKPFSFKGQDVEYRFKSDGTWEEMKLENPPDDGPEVPEAGTAERPAKRTAPAMPTQQAEPASRVWP